MRNRKEEIIECYPEDYPVPGCLMLSGYTDSCGMQYI